MPTWTGVIARVHVDRDSGKVTLKKLSIVIDAGTIVRPDSALAQTEGAALWGAGMALHETEFVNGRVKDVNLNSYTPMRILMCRRWTVVFGQWSSGRGFRRAGNDRGRTGDWQCGF